MIHADLAGRIDKSVQWVSAVEQGRRHADRLSDLVAIASVLNCSLDDLLGRPVGTLAPGGFAARAGSVAAVRAVMLRAAVPDATEGTSTVSEVGPRVAQAWATWHESPTAHTTLGEVLPGLLTDALHCYRTSPSDGATPERRVSARVLSGAWQITRQWLHHLPEPDLAWIAAERAMGAAREADDPHLIALGAWALSASYRRAGEPAEATRLCLAAGDELAPLIDASKPDPALLAAYGMLHLAAAIGAAQTDEDGRAWALHRVADDAARAVGAYYDPWTAFGASNVAIHAIAVSAALGDADAIVDKAATLDLDRMPSAHRRACVLIDTAGGFLRRGEGRSRRIGPARRRTGVRGRGPAFDPGP